MQFDHDLSLLKDLLREGLQRATLWLQQFNFSQDVSPLKEVIKEGLEPATLWLHLIGVSFAFTSDFLKRLYPHFTLKLAFSGAAFSALSGLGITFGIVPPYLGSVIFVFSVIVAILSSIMVGLQKYTGGENGALAELIPGVERLQEKLGIIEKKLEALRKKPGGGKRPRRTAANGGAGETEAA